jgi:DNA-binding XRE family transcriptional regulator
MQFQQALCYVMKERSVSQEELAIRTGANPRWIIEITTNPDWHPKLDTILRLCYALSFDVILFLELAEGTDHDFSKLPRRKQFSLEEQMILLLDVMPSHVAMALRAVRLESGLSQRKLAKLTPFSVHTISMREGHRNTSYPTVTTLELYCEAFPIKMSEFVARIFYYVQKEQKKAFTNSYFDNYLKEIIM